MQATEHVVANVISHVTDRVKETVIVTVYLRRVLEEAC